MTARDHRAAGDRELTFARMHGIQEDIVAEALRVTDAAFAAKVRLRVLGGVAVGLHAPDGVHPALVRPYRDLDLATTRKEGRAAAQLLAELGYSPNERFNAMNGFSRLVFYDEQHSRQVDVFVGTFEMCHALPITDRLDPQPRTNPPAGPLLAKVPIFQIKPKDPF